ncbi:MAG: adenylyltransferase/cytidyltransferase family protein [Candidatus Woesearchaeota archaeon]|nr:adenylyltransferase/cytidyltransferase family protein [Candidatus Woesearchaeota archaeon]
MITVLVFGTFDIVHPGHMNFLKQAKKHADKLVVVVARDLTVKALKGRFPENNEERRLKNIKKLPYVDEAMLGSLGNDKYEIIEKIKPDVIALGYDQYFFTEDLKKELKKRGILADIVRLKPYKEEIYKSSKLK